MHPRPQTSTAFPYLGEHSKIYGARYHLVAMFSVNYSYLFGEEGVRERMSPKSQIFTSQF